MAWEIPEKYKGYKSKMAIEPWGKYKETGLERNELEDAIIKYKRERGIAQFRLLTAEERKEFIQLHKAG